MVNASVHERVTEVGKQTSALFNEYTNEEIQNMQISDFVKIMKQHNQMIMMLRRRMQQHERDRLQINYNKVPKDITYLTKTEAELKRDLVLCIETGDEFLAV